ncbi:MAG: ABC transporter permease [Candidatus Kapabacteria bacterium]|nr:ABC transporter permease [Ignavibacteriota bacterium]MCW5884143.1 ABC transporter permease [Candidatus Kapabacteria bacterium]
MKTKGSKIFTIIQHEYISKVKSRGFILSTILAPLAIVLIYGTIIAVSIMSSGQTTKKIAVLDQTGEIGAELVARDTSKFFTTDKSEETLRQEVLDNTLDGYLIINDNFLQTGKADVFTSGGGGLGFISSIEKNTEDIIVNKRLREIGADKNIIDLVNRGVSISTKKVTLEGSKEDYSEMLAFLGYILGFMIYGLMFTYGSFVMRGVIEEKANRIVEVIASSARPFEIMFGKVVGIGAVGLTQVLFWLILLVILFAAGGTIAQMFIGAPDMAQMAGDAANQPEQAEIIKFFENFTISPWVIVAFLFYFLAGYFIYSSLFAAVGSAVDQEQDASQLSMPVALPIIIPIMFIPNVMNNPDGTLATVLSLIPFFTPILMIARVAATDVPLWQIALSVVLLAGTFLLCLWVAAKIYRVGILMYGKKPTFKDLIKWFKLD